MSLEVLRDGKKTERIHIKYLHRRDNITDRTIELGDFSKIINTGRMKEHEIRLSHF